MTKEQIVDAHLPLSPPVFHVLLALADGDKHGYAILKEVEERTNGKVQLSTGTLYAIIKRLLNDGLIEELDERPDHDDEPAATSSSPGSTAAARWPSWPSAWRPSPPSCWWPTSTVREPGPWPGRNRLPGDGARLPPFLVSETGDHPAQRLDDVVHQRVRLGILAVLDEADRADFTYLRQALGLTDGNLSRHLGVLQEAGLLDLTKTFEGRKPRTWVRATRKGKAALAAETGALRELVSRFDGTRG